MPSDKSLVVDKIILVSARVVGIIISIILRSVPIQIKSKIVHNSVIIEVQHCVTFRCDNDLLVFAGVRQTETCIMAITVAEACNIIFVTVIHRSVRDILAHPAVLDHKGASHFITISVQVLRPENDRIGCGCIRCPMGVNRCSFVKRIAEFKLVTAFSFGEPTHKRISITDHCTFSARFMCHIISQHKLRCVIGTTFTVFVEDQPVSSRKIRREHHIIGNHYRCVIRIQAIRHMSHDSPLITTLDIPPQKGMLIVQSEVLQNFIIPLRNIRHFQIVLGTQHRTHSVKIGDRKRFIQQRIIINRIAIRDACIQQALHICAHASDSHGMRSICHTIRIALFFPIPASENQSLVLTGTWVVNNLVEQSIVRIVRIYIVRFHHNGSLSVRLHKRHRETGIAAGLRHNIHRERLGGESDHTILDSHRGHKLVAVGTLVIDIHHLSVSEARVGNGDRHRLTSLGLPFGTAVVDGDVVGTEHLLAVRGGALHRHGVHLRLRGHLPGDGELHLAAVGGEHLRTLHRRGLVSHAAGRRVVAVVLRPCGRLESRQHHQHKAECQGNVFSHGLVRAVVGFHQVLSAWICHCRICHDVKF